MAAALLLLSNAARFPRAGRARTSPPRQPPPFQLAFQLHLPHGTCVALSLPTLSTEDEHRQLEDQLARTALLPEEMAFMRSLGRTQRIFFAGGRVALRHAIAHAHLGASSPSHTDEAPSHLKDSLSFSRDSDLAAAACHPLLRDSLGAPLLPKGWVGSISHTRGLAAAIAVKAEHSNSYPRKRVGIDVEATSRPISPRLPRRCLTQDERASLGKTRGLDERADALLRFSLKEALYKAIHPFVRKSIPWHSVEVSPVADGTCVVNATGIEEWLGARMEVEAGWRQCHGFYVSTATAMLCDLGD